MNRSLSPVLVYALLNLGALALMSLGVCLWQVSAARSFGLGGLLTIFPQLYFVQYAFRYRANQRIESVERMLQSVKWGEAGKLALTAAGFIVVFKTIDHLNELALFAGFIVMIGFGWAVAPRVTSVVDQRSKNNE